VLGVVVLCVI